MSVKKFLLKKLCLLKLVYFYEIKFVKNKCLFLWQIVDAGKFWVQDASESTQQELAYILHMLNKGGAADLTPLSSPPSVGQLLVAPFEGRYMYRAKVVSVQEFRQGVSVVVSFIILVQYLMCCRLLGY
jgi:hypothetical protein